MVGQLYQVGRRADQTELGKGGAGYCVHEGRIRVYHPEVVLEYLSSPVAFPAGSVVVYVRSTQLPGKAGRGSIGMEGQMEVVIRCIGQRYGLGQRVVGVMPCKGYT